MYRDASSSPQAPPPRDPSRLSVGAVAELIDDGIDLRRHVETLKRHRWLILGLAAAGLVGGFALSRLVRPVYEAQASVQVPSFVRSGSDGGLRSEPLLHGPAWTELLRSFEVLDGVVRSQRLFLEPAVAADTVYFANLGVAQDLEPGSYQLSAANGRVQLRDASGQLVEDAAVGDSLGTSIGLRWLPHAPPNGHTVAFELWRPRDAAVRLEQSLATNLPPEGSFLRLSLRGHDPQATAITLNAVATRFVDVATLLKKEKLTSVTRDLQDQLQNARFELDAVERALESYKVATITLPSDRGATPIAPGLSETRDPVRQAFFQLRLDRDALVRDRDALDRVLAAGDSGTSFVAALSVIPAARDSRELMETLTQLSEKRAELRQARVVFAAGRPERVQLERAVAELEQEVLPTQARELRASLAQRIAGFDERIAASSREMQEIPVRATEERRRERDVAVAQMIATELQEAYEQARLAELSATPDVRVLDVAVPPTRPVSDRVFIIVGVGLGLGLALGLALAYMSDRLDKRVRYPEHVTEDLGLQMLGVLPMVRRGKDGLPLAEDEAHVLESCRAIRMSLLYAHGVAGPFVTTVTSPGNGDGKSFVSRQLAKSFALSGRRTLLIDGDTRRGLQHRAHGVERKPGLVEVLAGHEPLDRAIRPAREQGYDLLPCGTRRANAPELLASPTMAELMQELRGRYQAIIVDSPPLGAGVDPLALAALSGTLVLVLRNGRTDREYAGHRLGEIERLPIRILGAVLNDVSAQGAYRHYSYLPGYGAEDEAHGEALPLLTSGTAQASEPLA